MKSLLAWMFVVMATAAWAETPEQRARMYFSDIEHGRYAEAAGHIEPSQLKEFRNLMGFYLELPPEPRKQFIDTFFGANHSPESLQRMNDVEFFSAILGFMLRQFEATGGLHLDSLEILGGVREGKTTIHLVTRNRVSVGAVTAETMDVLSLRKVGGQWRVMMSSNIKGLPEQLKAAFGSMNAPRPGP